MFTLLGGGSWQRFILKVCCVFCLKAVRGSNREAGLFCVFVCFDWLTDWLTDWLVA